MVVRILFRTMLSELGQLRSAPKVFTEVVLRTPDVMMCPGVYALIFIDYQNLSLRISTICLNYMKVSVQHRAYARFMAPSSCLM